MLSSNRLEYSERKKIKPDPFLTPYGKTNSTLMKDRQIKLQSKKNLNQAHIYMCALAQVHV
jgi:hypothetical protein